MSNKTVNLLIVIFGGMLGVHKFISGQIKMGIIYLFTGGLFMFGWIVDIIKVALGKESYIKRKSIMNSSDLTLIRNGELPIIYGTPLNLSNDETCCYVDSAYTFKDKILTTGYTGKSRGMSIKLMDGLTYHTGGSGSQAIREKQRTTYYGFLYLTNKRVVYTSEKDSFDKPIEKITSIQEAKDGLVIQVGSNTYSIIVKTHKEFIQALNIVKQLN